MNWKQFFGEHSGVICENTSEERELLTEILDQGMTIDFDEINEYFVTGLVSGKPLSEEVDYPVTYGIVSGKITIRTTDAGCIPFRDALAADRRDTVFVEDLI